MENRVTELESRIAFLDDTVQSLNDVIARQQLLLNKFERDLDAIKTHVKTLSSELPGQGTGDEPPPHY